MAALCNRWAIIFLPCDFFSSICLSFFPRLISAAADWMSTILVHMAWPYANLECRSELCCSRLAANTGRKKVAKNRHLGTIAQLRRAISSQQRHISTIGKKLVKQQYLLHMSLQYGELRPTSCIFLTECLHDDTFRDIARSYVCCVGLRYFWNVPKTYGTRSLFCRYVRTLNLRHCTKMHRCCITISYWFRWLMNTCDVIPVNCQ